MSVTVSTNKNTATGDGVTLSPFVFTFDLQQAADVQVYVSGVLKTINTDYTITPNGGAYPCVGGFVTFTVAPANLAPIIINRAVQYTQQTVLPRQGPLPSAPIEQMIDKAMMSVQQLAETSSRALTLPITSAGSVSLELPAPEAITLLRWKNDLSGIENVDANTALSDAGGLGGNVTAPAGATTAFGIALFADTLGHQLKEGPTTGTAGQRLTSQGPGVAPVFTNSGDMLKAKGIDSSTRAIPASGAISGTYIHNGNFSTGGNYTIASGTKLYVNGNFTINAGNAFDVTALSNGGAGNQVGAQRGGGLGGGEGAGFYATPSLPAGGGGGGANGGAGGQGGTNSTPSICSGGTPYPISHTGGSGGGGGSGSSGSGTSGVAGGGGGGALYIEVNGNVTINETINANGVAGTGAGTSIGAGGGGSGGTVEIRCTGTITLAGGKKISCVGGAGGAKATTSQNGGGGGGGQILLWSGGAQTITGTLDVSGGAKGTGTATGTDATAGATGVTILIPNVQPVSL